MSDLHQLTANKLAALSHRYTSNRRAVVEALDDLDGPATIAELMAADSDLAQSSTYRNLVVLEEVGVVHRIITGDDHARFELAEEVTGHHHHHLICQECGSIIDMLLPADLESALDKALEAVAKASNFRCLYHRVDGLGLCHKCSEG